jgi:hypothetical protein
MVNKNKYKIFYIVTIIIVAFFGIDLEYIQRQLIIPKTVPNEISKILSLIFILVLPFIYKKILRMLTSSKMILFFVSYTIFITLLSYIISKILGYNPRFSNEYRTIVQIGGLIIGIILGYYISKINEEFPKTIVLAIHLSIFFVFLGIFYQFIGKLFFETGARYQGRLFGLSGEPKFLGLYLVPYLIALVVSSSRFSLGKILLIICCITAITLTKSSTAFVALIFMIAIYCRIYGFMKIKTIYFLMIMLLLILIIFILPDINNIKKFIFVRIQDYYYGVFDIDMQEQFIFPIIGAVTVEANEFPLLLFFKDNPFFIFTGVGLGQESILSFRYIDELEGGSGFLKPGRDGYITPNSALLFNTGNFGLLMIAVLYSWAMNIAKKNNKYLNENQKFIFYFFLSHFLIQLLIFKSDISLTTSMVVLLSIAASFNKKNTLLKKKQF